MERVRRRSRVLDAQAPLKDLRDIKVLVFHPDNQDGLQLIQQLQRIGCQVQAFWPPLPVLPERTEVVFLAIRPDALDVNFEWLKTEDEPTLIAVVDFENPTIVEAVIKANAKAILPLPIRTFGLLSTLVVARELNVRMKEQQKKLRKVEEKLLGVQRITEAKNILMRMHGISDADAYKLMRGQAMSKRTTVEDIAAAIISADGILSFEK
ncbi:ANTAR domain-containing response regulator [Thiomonas sp.]